VIGWFQLKSQQQYAVTGKPDEVNNTLFEEDIGWYLFVKKTTLHFLSIYSLKIKKPTAVDYLIERD
jgi:hypothetical protein